MCYLLQIQHSGLHPGHVDPLVHLVNAAFHQTHRERLHHQQLHLCRGAAVSHPEALSGGERDTVSSAVWSLGNRAHRSSKPSGRQLYHWTILSPTTYLVHSDFSTFGNFFKSELSVIGRSCESHLKKIFWLTIFPNNCQRTD